MDAPIRTNVDELKERLRVYAVKVPTEIVDDFVALEEGLKAEVRALIQSIAVGDQGGGYQIDPNKVPRTMARMLIRSMFATIEGITYGMKQLAFAASRDDGPLTFGELLICREVTFGLKSNGEVDGSAMHLKLAPNLRFAFAVVAKVFHQAFELDTNCQGWNRLVESVRVRNRLTHPKRSSDLELTDDELSHAIEAYQWFDRQLGSLVEGFISEVQKSNHYFAAMLKHGQSPSSQAPVED